MSSEKMHENEHKIDESLVRRLLLEQFPEWAELPLSHVKTDGTVNAIFRLGSDMCVRLPRIPDVDHQIEVEQQWLPKLAPHLPLEIPIPLEKGNPTEHYPWHWSVYRWLEGKNAYIAPIDDLDQAAIVLAQFINALHQISPPVGLTSQRCGPLATQDAETREAIHSLREDIDTVKMTKIWEECLNTPLWDKPPVWIHGDLLPANLLAHHGRLRAVIDFGLFGVGDPACDLIPAWGLFDKGSREVFQSTLGIDDATWKRGRGWALSIGLIILPYYKQTNLGLYAVGKRMVHEVLAELP
jgi:aminoglycoside phosphotransferase (APT) family kinase protein